MGRIRSLPPHVVNQIAAGEVIERPASVVKELVENAIDAGARRVDVRIADGGRGRIEVADDGEGMDADDLSRAFLPHATSKLSDVADLEHVASLGFRGEALASVGAVARASIVSRPRGAATAHRVEDREGAVSDVAPAAGAEGTVVVVEGLFLSVPARRRFLRTAATEAGHVQDAVVRAALANPDVAFSLEHDGRVVLRVAAGDGRAARIARFHGEETAAALVHVAPAAAPERAPDGAPCVEAYVSRPGLGRGDARLQQAWLNGRPIRDRTVLHALREAYRDLVPPGGDRQPVAFVFLSCDPARVDVNVHPTKAEVRWRDPSRVHEAVRRAIRGPLEAAAPGVPIVAGATRAGLPDSLHRTVEFAFTHGVGAPAFPREATAGLQGHGACADPAHEHASHGAPPDPAATTPAEDLRPIGQALGTYLVLEAPDGLVLVDQHALHERVLFDEISARIDAAAALEVQRLLVPLVVRLAPADVARLEEERDLLGRLGWLVEPFGGDAVAVHGHPAVLRRPDPEAVLREVLEVLDAGARDGLSKSALVSSVVDRLACRAAVMAGDRLRPEEVLALLERAERLNHSHSCPHGRPTRLRLSRRELERHFHRTV